MCACLFSPQNRSDLKTNGEHIARLTHAVLRKNIDAGVKTVPWFVVDSKGDIRRSTSIDKLVPAALVDDEQQLVRLVDLYARFVPNGPWRQVEALGFASVVLQLQAVRTTVYTHDEVIQFAMRNIHFPNATFRSRQGFDLVDYAVS
jgi:hypothetical protein